jgi:hypothetical protein
MCPLVGGALCPDKVEWLDLKTLLKNALGVSAFHLNSSGRKAPPTEGRRDTAIPPYSPSARLISAMICSGGRRVSTESASVGTSRAANWLCTMSAFM